MRTFSPQRRRLSQEAPYHALGKSSAPDWNRCIARRQRESRLPRSRPRSATDRPHSARLDDGREVVTPWGGHWLVEQPLEQVWPAGPRWIDQGAQRPTTRSQDMPPELLLLERVFPQGVVLLDLETCGLAGCMIFLAGLIHEDQGQLQVCQLWARDYSEEKPLLQSLWNLVQHKELLITFNGKSFDWPQVHDRSTLHHLGYRQQRDGAAVARSSARHAERLTPDQQRPEPVHLDLLHHARRRWHRHLPNCRLQTLERYICGRQRTGDIPGRDIPAAYHDSVRTGSTHAVQAILHHNALDLVTLLQLALTLWRSSSC